MDYGLASSLDALPGEDPDDDREAEICGTAAYLAPETLVQQKSGKPTDVYAVALILLEMLTGQQVFRGDTLSQVLYRQIHTSVRLPAKLAWTSLGKCLLKALSKHPDNRFADADAFYEALEHAAQTTATYFRLDPSDLDPLDESMPPELLARMMRNQRARQKSERGGDGGGDEDSDDSEPGPPAHRAPPGSDFLGDSGSLGGSDFLGESDFPGKPEADDSALPDNKPSAPAESTSWAFLPHFELGASPLVPPPFPLPNSPSGKRAAPPRPGLRSAEQPPAGIASGDGDEDAAAFARARFPRAGDPPDKVRHADSDSGADDAQRDEADHDAADLQNAPAQDGDERIDADWVTRGGIALVTLLFVLAALGVYMTASWA
jgi:serine/threonine protein kinase